MDDGGGEAFDLFNVDGEGNLTIPKATSKFQPKLKGRRLKSESIEESHGSLSSSSALTSFVVKVEDDLSMEKPAVDLIKDEDVDLMKDENDKDAMAVGDEILKDECVEMDVDANERENEDDDPVVREIDVFLNPSPIDKHTQLYVMQYPLRPYWRPYDLEEKCEDVRVKQNQTEVEFDLALNDGENYDDEFDEHLQLKVQTLSSSKVPLVTSYAVGIMKQNQLHLNPVHAVVQLRPSMEYLTSSKVQLGKVEQNHINDDQSLTDSNNENWTKLKFHPVENSSSTSYRQKLVAEDIVDIQFHMKSHDYVNNLCPVMSYYSHRTSGPSKRILQEPLEERMRILFMKGPQVHRFDALMHFAPNCSMDDVLKLLSEYADLVQGLWISKSSLICDGPEVIARDFILLLFSKRSIIPLEDLKPIKSDVQNRIMIPLARKRPSLNDWKLKEPTDFSFLKRFPHIVKQHEILWSNREKNIMNSFQGFGRSLHKLTKEQIKPFSSNTVSNTSNLSNNTSTEKGLSDSVGVKPISDEARELVQKAITQVLRNHKVCSLNVISQKLHDSALLTSVGPVGPKRDPSSIFAAIKDSPQLLKDMIDQVATPIHDVYVLRSTGQVLDSFRSVVVDLYRGKKHKAMIKKAEIAAAAKYVLKRDISNQEYTQVMSELCISNKGGGWVLKRGDGSPD